MELLVAVSLLAILALLTVPAVNRLIDNGRNARCVSNLRQIGVAMHGFAGENNGAFPHVGGVIAFGETDPITGLPSWAEQLSDYIPVYSEVFQCPSNPVDSPNHYFKSAWAPFVDNGRTWGPMRLARVSMPSAMILVGDCTVIHWKEPDADKDDCNGEIIPTFGAGWHAGKSNILFVDGHVSGETAFDPERMTTRYEGTGYGYFSEPDYN